MPVTSGPFPKGAFCRVLWGFSIGRYGWTESFVRPFGSIGFQGVRDSGLAVAKLRMAMCGNGVFMDTMRLSDIAVRRDADDTAVALLAKSASSSTLPDFFFTQVATAEDAETYNPNICIVTRMEGPDKVYHGQHSLGGMPASKFVGGERLNNRPNWTIAFNRWSTRLRQDGYGFLALSREAPGFDDVPVVDFVRDTKTVILTAVPASWVPGDRIRIINAVVEGKRRGGSIVGELDTKAANTFTYRLGTTLPLNIEAGPATIAHKEATAFVDLSFLEPEYASHRNRGRPLFTPRGRRSRK